MVVPLELRRGLCFSVQSDLGASNDRGTLILLLFQVLVLPVACVCALQEEASAGCG